MWYAVLGTDIAYGGTRTLAAKAMQVSCLEEGNEGEDREKGEKGRTGEGMRERMRKAFVRREDTQHTTQS